MSLRKKENHNGNKLLCDYAHCQPTAEFRPRGMVIGLDELRWLAKRQGWTSQESVATHGLVLDFCPEHRPPRNPGGRP